MKRTKQLLIAALISGGIFGASSAQALEFPNSNYFQYGDFRSYSLPLLNQLNGLPTNKGGYILDSSPGKIMNDIVIYSGTNNNDVMNNNLNKGDNAYSTPAGGVNYFSTSLPTPADPGGANEFTGDTANTWDVQLSALSSYLNGSDLFFFYNHNQTGGSPYLWAWGRATLVDTTGQLANLNFDFTNTPNGGKANGSALSYTSTGGAVPQPDTFVPVDPDTTNPTTDPNYIYVPGEVNGVNHNLGADDAAFAIFSPELNEYVQTVGFGGYDVLQIDMRLAGINNGYEQLFIQKGHNAAPVPEPGTMMLLGMGMLGLAVYGKRRMNSK